MDMITEYTAKQIAEILDVSVQAVHKRAKNEKWMPIYRKARGGMKNVYLTSLLPRDIRTEITVKAQREFIPDTNSARAGSERARAIACEESRRAEERRRIKERNLDLFNALPDKRKQEAYAKHALLKARDGFMKALHIKAIKRGSQLFAEEYQAGNISLPEHVLEYARRTGKLSVSWSSLNRWQKLYDEAGLLGLTNGYQSKRKSSVPEDIQEFIQGLITRHPHIKFRRIMDAVKARYQNRKLPCESAIRRYVTRWKSENESLLMYIADPDAWKNTFMFAAGDAAETVTALNQLWEMDSTPADIMLKDGRHSLIGCIDVWSRRLKLLVTPSSKSTAISALIRRCLIDWGAPPPTRELDKPNEGIKTDNGKDYVADHIVRVLEGLDINQILCPPFTPEAKPFVERAFRTFSHGIVELLPGFIGHNVAERKAIEARKSFADRLMTRGETVEVSMSAEEFQVLCDRWVNAIYHQDVHSMLGCSPAEKARSWKGNIRRVNNERALDMLLCVAAGRNGRRTVTKKGIRVDRGRYIAAELAGHEGEDVLVYEDPTDLGTIYVYEPDGQFICAAQDPERTGIDRSELAAKVKNTQKKMVSEGAKKLKKIAREARVDTIYEEILAHREAQIANIRELPKPSEEFMTRGLTEAAYAAVERGHKVPPPEQTIQVDREKLATEMKDNVREIPQDPKGRYRLCRELEQRHAAGETLSDRERRFMESFQKNTYYKAFRSVEEDLGWQAAEDAAESIAK